MKLIKSIEDEYFAQLHKENGNIPILNKNFISKITWHRTIEGTLFWNILHYSFMLKNRYDYETLIKLFLRFGHNVFKKRINSHSIYIYHYDKEKGTLSDKGIEVLFKMINNEINSKHTH